LKEVVNPKKYYDARGKEQELPSIALGGHLDDPD
jgi:hypothetical protein